MKPYIIVHMMTSIDGRIDCPMVGQLSTDEYEVALDKFGLCSKLSGRVTAALECPAVKEESDRIGEQPVLQESIHIARSSDEYTIVVDTYGKLSWQANTSDGHPVLCIVSEQVSQTYLDTLHFLEISWIVVGSTKDYQNGNYQRDGGPCTCRRTALRTPILRLLQNEAGLSSPLPQFQ